MVLNELGARIGAALAQMSNAATIDEGVLDACLKEISNALVQVRALCPDRPFRCLCASCMFMSRELMTGVRVAVTAS